ncbi:Hypothetical protein LUCI_1643 [Lucifera butyrica]|uniref:histidine kinase n=1 Tax=Lucifera butyrica TaxID=1351585 RepID=A0A498R808_9FIRM|nr:HAMP domain-containing sensor histidine kinase [Lucifera butyrica]VBB06412.1 Hypothetical protein LUCI_1643 [Lucifera butyrica]
MTRSIFSKILLSHIVVILVTTTTLGLFMSYLVRIHVVEAKRQDLLAKGDTIVRMLLPIINSGRVPIPRFMNAISGLVGATVWIMDDTNFVVAGSPPEQWHHWGPDEAKELKGVFSGTPQSWVHNNRRNTDPSIVVALPIPSTSTALFMYAPIFGVNQTAEALERLVFISVIVGILVAVTLGFIISRGVTRPIADISRAAARFAKGEYDSRTKATADDEVGSLGRTFNTMAESLAHVEQNRRDFLANVSHELKTPVATIQALSETILDGMATRPEQQQRYLSTIVNESKRIDRLIHDLLDLSQLEAGELSIAVEKLDLTDFLAAEKEKYVHLLENKHLVWNLMISSKLPTVLADRYRLSQVMSNLISNAIRHAPENSPITVKAQSNGAYVSIAVIDKGPGIPPAALPYIWERFYRVDKSRARNDGGTGLGLSITKKLMQAMHGDISVESKLNEGTAFILTLPIVSA